jgi:hypothetical protein
MKQACKQIIKFVTIPLMTRKREVTRMFMLNARIPEALAEKVKIRAVREKKTVQQLVAEALGDYLKKPLARVQEDEQ